MKMNCVVVALVALSQLSASFKVGLDLNTFDASELSRVNELGDADFTWAIMTNSPGVNDAQWKQAYDSLNAVQVFSEDNPDSYDNCIRMRQITGTLLAAFGYHETGGQPNTMLNWQEIDTYHSKCGAGVVVLTRAYWPGSHWRTGIEAILGHPNLFGVAMEFDPSGTGLRNEVDFVNAVTGAGKTAFFLWPFGFLPDKTTETVMDTAIRWMRSAGINMANDLISVVIARYGQPQVQVYGTVNTIQSALNTARAWQEQVRMSDNHINNTIILK